jgi:Ca2+-binding RTX toxin-like protein
MTPTRISPRAAAALAALAAGLALPATAGAAITPAFNANSQTVTFTGDAAGDTLVIGEQNGLLTQSVNGGPASTDIAGSTRPADNTINLVVNAGDGADTITVATPNLAAVVIDGQEGADTVTGDADDDLLRGGAGVDTLNGGEGDDRIVGDTGGDDMNGGNGNDVLAWNNGDGSDTMDGDGGGGDEVEVNGAATVGDAFTINPNGPRVDFDRTNLIPFSLDISAERIAVNGLGGDDTITGAPGLAPLIAATLSGGSGADTITGGDGADSINGGDDADQLTGGAGGDRIAGDRGGDAMRGSDGDDTLVWNNGDGSDEMDGEGGLDRVEVNGAGGGDAFTIAPNGGRAKFDRTNIVPFTLNIGSAEALDARGLGGDDRLVAQPGTGSLLAVTADGGAGNDVLTGAEESDTFSGGSGNDELTGGNGPDLLDGQDGDDTLRARDGQGDLARGGAGNDSAQTDVPGLDVIDGVESVDALTAPPVVAPDTKGTAARIAGRNAAVQIRGGRASTRLRVACPAAEASGCIGTVTLLSAKPVRIGGQRVAVVLGSARYALTAGQTKRVTIRLPKRVRKLAKGRALAAVAQIVTRDGAGNVATGSRAVSLRLPK